jgi:hypothetical protein
MQFLYPMKTKLLLHNHLLDDNKQWLNRFLKQRVRKAKKHRQRLLQQLMKINTARLTMMIMTTCLIDQFLLAMILLSYKH